MSTVYIPSKEDLENIISKITRQTLSEILPDAIRKANRKEWLTSKEVLEILDCSNRHLQYLRDSNQIIFSQNGRTIRYHIDDVEDFLNRHKVKSLRFNDF